MKFLLFLVPAALADITGIYHSASSSTACPSVHDLVLKAGTDTPNSSLIIKRYCSQGDNISKISFGTWRYSDKNLVELYSNGNAQTATVVEGKSYITYNGAVLTKESESAPMNKIAAMFGQWKAVNAESTEVCSVASKLEVTNNGRLVRYFCKDGNNGWFTSSLFNIDSFDGQTIYVSSTVNGTSDKATFTVNNSNQIVYNGKITLNRA